MKNYTNLILTFFLLFSFQSFSQGLQYEIGINDSYKQEILQIANKNEFSYALVKYDYFYVYLEKYDTLGNRLIKKPLWENQDLTSMNPGRMIITNDNNIWISGAALFCDVPNEAQHVYVYDSNCQRINSYVHTYDITQNGNSFITGMGAISDTSVAVNFHYFDSSWVEIFTTTTNDLLQNFQMPFLYGFGLNTQFHLLSHSLNKLYAIDSQGILLDSISLPDAIVELGIWNDTIIVLGSQKIFKISPDLQSYAMYSFSNLSQFARLKVDGQGIRFCSNNLGNSYAGVHSLNHNLDIQSLTTIPLIINFHKFDFDKSLTAILGFGLTHFDALRIVNYSLSTAQNNSINRSDIAVLGMDFTEYLSQYVTVGNVYKLNAKANVLIKNVGQNLVDSVRLSHYIPYNQTCGEDVTAKYFSGLNLAPGDSIWVDFGWLGEYTNVVFSDSIKRTYCVYSSNPNGIVDLNVSNDNICKTAFFGMLGQEELNELSFQIYPNPVENELKIKHLNSDEVMYSITNSVGQIFQQEFLKMSSIDVSSLTAGIYFITLSDKSGKLHETKTFIKN